MKTIKVYMFSELSEDVQQKVAENTRGEDCDWFFSEANNSFEKFADEFGVKWQSIDYLEPYRNEYRVPENEYRDELTGVRLATWLHNNLGHVLYAPKFIGSLKSNEVKNHKRIRSKKLRNGNAYNPYYSGCQMQSRSCNLTGVCYDDDLLDSFYNFLENPVEGVSYSDLVDEAISSLCNSLQSEYEYHNSVEGKADFFDSNDFWFTEHGEEVTA